jgi:hypothetical protein
MLTYCICDGQKDKSVALRCPAEVVFRYKQVHRAQNCRSVVPDREAILWISLSGSRFVVILILSSNTSNATIQMCLNRAYRHARVASNLAKLHLLIKSHQEYLLLSLGQSLDSASYLRDLLSDQ